MHLRTCTKEKLFTCDTCSKGFSENCNLKEHVRIDSKEKPLFIKYIWKQFTQGGDLKKVILKTHTKEKPFSCENLF